MVTYKAPQLTLDEFFSAKPPEATRAGREWDEDDDLRRFIRGGLAAK